MKATGIVRRIDDLGRVVVPKEIRRTLRIREGDPLEIFTDREGEIILKKYSPIGEMNLFAKQYAEALSQVTGHIVCITDRDQVIAAAGSGKKELMERSLSKQIENLMSERETLTATHDSKKFIPVINEQQEDYTAEVIYPVICEGDVIGSVVFLSRDTRANMGETEQKLANVAAGFLGRQMEA
ncbi:MAG: stage V sporulation protein T [Lachnospiraceae bacterium]|nr:stage V sporulation protein T [Lachnospiraceae bacterium]